MTTSSFMISFAKRSAALSLFLIGLAVHSLHAQIIDNRLGNVFKEEMYFNQEFLWQNKIKTITGVTSIKRPNRPIEQRPDMFVFHFNTVGLLQQMDKVTSIMNLVDSLRIEYKRNDVGEVELRSENSKKGFYTTQYFYDKEGRIERLDYGKSENISTDAKKLIPGQRISINSETYAYQLPSANILRKNKMNNYGLHYASVVVTKSDLGYITSETEELVMSGKTVTRNYTYNSKGWVEHIETKDNMGGSVKKETFFYDDLGNLLKVEYRTGNELVEEVEVLYTETMLIEALLRHNLQSKEIVITKFSYEFHS